MNDVGLVVLFVKLKRRARLDSCLCFHCNMFYSGENIGFFFLYFHLQHKPFGRTDVSWNPDGSVMALGNEDG